ncbi:hypothetical protein LSTR_LSTR014812 [Laodelphax striatellus]|uniref:Uncharacterized protein n=1 Tax=Laodelphax striatellus TaxID=195883 RepID=A0A482X7Q5_LAOST|nr:hypothetical protein LSTR_LSTR014812 [Laodelphax striatellus]
MECSYILSNNKPYLINVSIGSIRPERASPILGKKEINERSSDAEQSRGIRRTFTVGDKKGGEDSWDHPSSGNRFRSTCSCLQHFRIRSFAGARSKSNDELADEVDREEEREVAGSSSRQLEPMIQSFQFRCVILQPSPSCSAGLPQLLPFPPPPRSSNN